MRFRYMLSILIQFLSGSVPDKLFRYIFREECHVFEFFPSRDSNFEASVNLTVRYQRAESQFAEIIKCIKFPKVEKISEQIG